MSRSSLTGIDRAPGTAEGRDSEALGPSDTSDSGSDVAGLGQPDDSGPDAPLDVAVGADVMHPGTSPETVGDGIDTDARGTGERRSAGGDAGDREAADISPDRIIGADEAEVAGDDGAVLPANAAALDDDADEDDEEGLAAAEDEDADPVGTPPRGDASPPQRGRVGDAGSDSAPTTPPKR